MTSTHGLVQSETHAGAARRYSASLAKRETLKYGNDVAYTEAVDAEIEDRKMALDAAYDAYTHRGKVVKTVDVRWPAVSADPLATAKLLAQGH